MLDFFYRGARAVSSSKCMCFSKLALLGHRTDSGIELEVGEAKLEKEILFPHPITKVGEGRNSVIDGKQGHYNGTGGAER